MMYVCVSSQLHDLTLYHIEWMFPDRRIRRICGFDPAGRQHSFVEIDHEIFSVVMLPSTNSRRAVVSFWRKNVQNTG